MDELGAGGRVELVEHMIQMTLDGAGADAELACDGLVRHAPGDQADDFLLPRRQPGGNVADEKPNERYGWPSRCEYATESWTLARNMQNMFGSTFLMDCVGDIVSVGFLAEASLN